MRRLVLMAALLGSSFAFAESTGDVPQKLYFAIELRHDGKVVGAPKLLGQTGKVVRAERRQPGALKADYRLALAPVASTESKGKFDISLDVVLPDARGSGHFSLHHGEQRKVELGKERGDLQVSLLVMQVDSPEFRALMDLVAVEERRAKSTSI